MRIGQHIPNRRPVSTQATLRCRLSKTLLRVFVRPAAAPITHGIIFNKWDLSTIPAFLQNNPNLRDLGALMFMAAATFPSESQQLANSYLSTHGFLQKFLRRASLEEIAKDLLSSIFLLKPFLRSENYSRLGKDNLKASYNDAQTMLRIGLTSHEGRGIIKTHADKMAGDSLNALIESLRSDGFDHNLPFDIDARCPGFSTLLDRAIELEAARMFLRARDFGKLHVTEQHRFLEPLDLELLYVKRYLSPTQLAWTYALRHNLTMIFEIMVVAVIRQTLKMSHPGSQELLKSLCDATEHYRSQWLEVESPSI